MLPTVPMSTLFPLHIRKLLVAASKVDQHIDMPGEVETRNRAVDDAIEAARADCPHLFSVV